MNKQNFFLFPADLADLAFAKGLSRNDILVLTYLVMHDTIEVTVDELMNGRKNKDGKRLDKGLRLSKPTLIRSRRICIDLIKEWKGENG